LPGHPPGQDRQLEVAVAELLKQLQEKPREAVAEEQ